MLCNMFSTDEDSNSTPAIFICGVGRSGTSLLQNIVGSHSEIVFLPETAFIRRLIASGKFYRTFLNDGISGLDCLLKNDPVIHRFNVNISWLLNQYFSTSPSTKTSAVGFYETIRNHYQKESDKKYVGDKDPRLIEYLGLVNRYWPEAYIIHVIRDPRDILASKKIAGWSKNRFWWTHVFANRIQLRIGRLLGPRYFGNRYYELIYEKLLADPEKEIERLCQFLGLNYHAEMLSYHQTARNLVSRDEMGWKNKTLGPILRNNYGKWKTQLKPLEIALTEQVCCEHFNAGGYKYSSAIKQLPAVWQFIVHIMATIIILLDPIYRIYRRWFIWWHQKCG